MNTNLIIRVQARGGMYLGPDSFGGAVVTIKDVLSGKFLASGFTDNGDSGSRLPAFSYDASPSPIVTPITPVPIIYWVIASSTTVQFATTIDLKSPALLEISAKVPLPPAQGDQIVSATSWVWPGQDLSTGAGFVLEVPGLWVQPEIIANGLQIKLRAKVTMMCGCEINAGSPWLPGDFEVQAAVVSRKQKRQVVPLAFEVNSQFTGELTLPEAGEYEVHFMAQQKSIPNSGVAMKGVKVG